MIRLLLYLNFIALTFPFFINQHSYLNGFDDSISNDLNSNAIYEIINISDTLWLRTGDGLAFMIWDETPQFYSIVDNKC